MYAVAFDHTPSQDAESELREPAALAALGQLGAVPTLGGMGELLSRPIIPPSHVHVLLTATTGQQETQWHTH